MGRPRKLRPIPKPVGRPRKVLTPAEQLAKMNSGELAQLALLAEQLEQPHVGRHRAGDRHPTNGKVFLRYMPYWVTPERYEREKARVLAAVLKIHNERKQAQAQTAMAQAQSNTDPNQSEV